MPRAVTPGMMKVDRHGIHPPDEFKPGVGQGRYPAKYVQFKKYLFDHPELTPTQCARNVLGIKDTKNKYPATWAARCMKILGITHQDIFDRIGLTDEQDVLDLLRMRKATRTVRNAFGQPVDYEENFDIQYKALELTLKIKKALGNQDANTNPNSQNNIQIIIGSIRESDAIGIRSFMESLRKRISEERPV